MFCPHCSIILMIPLAFDEKFAFSANAYTPRFREKRNFERQREICFFSVFGELACSFVIVQEKKRRLTSAGMFTDCFSFSHFVWGPTQHDFWHQTKPPKQDGEKGGQQPQREQMTYWSRLLPYSQHLPINKRRKKTTLPHLSAPINGDATESNLGIKFRWLGPSAFFHSEFFYLRGGVAYLCVFITHIAPPPSSPFIAHG